MREVTERRLRHAVAERAGCSQANDDGTSDGYAETMCAYCGTLIVVLWPEDSGPRFKAKMSDGEYETAHLDHVIPECRNGPTSLDNTVLACSQCNIAKRARPFGDPEFLEYVEQARFQRALYELERMLQTGTFVFEGGRLMGAGAAR